MTQIIEKCSINENIEDKMMLAPLYNNDMDTVFRVFLENNGKLQWFIKHIANPANIALLSS